MARNSLHGCGVFVARNAWARTGLSTMLEMRNDARYRFERRSFHNNNGDQVFFLVKGA
jgi:hypothetical protein